MSRFQSTLGFLSLIVLVFAFVYVVPAFSVVVPIPCAGIDINDPDQCNDQNDVDGDGCTDCMVDPGYTCDNRPLLLPFPQPSICDLGCDITVVKSASPAYNTEFDYTRVTLPLLRPKVVEDFTLADSDSPDTDISVPFLSLTFIAELETPGWEVDSIQCLPTNRLGDGGFNQNEVPEALSGIDFGNIVLALCLFSGEGTCTFNNVPIQGEECNIRVNEQVVGAFNDVEFPFSVTAGDPENPPLNEQFDLLKNQSEVVEDQPLSSVYTITQDTPEDFNLDSIQCDGDADFDFILVEGEDSGAVQVTCNSPGEVSCTFVNSAIIVRNVPTLSEWGLVATAVVLGMAGIIFYRRRMLRA